MEVLTVEHIGRKIKEKEILKDVSFSLHEGEIVGLVGANGAGKTTLMKVLLGLTNYQKGVIKVKGKEVPHVNHLSVRIGALIEHPGIYPYLTGFQNLKLFYEGKDKKEIIQIVDLMNMSDYIHKKAKNYSLGMKQKLGIAMALLNNPKVILLDEPMNGLDPQGIRDVRNIILKFAKNGVTFLISSHILSELEKVANSILLLHNGQILPMETLEEMPGYAEGDLESAFLQIIDSDKYYDSENS